MIGDDLEVKVAFPGTCGEWLQGWFQGEPVLLSCPIERYSRVTVKPRGGHDILLGTGCQKAYQAAKMACSKYKIYSGLEIRIDSDLDRSRGYASSTADIAAVISGIGKLAGVKVSAADIAKIACDIEPSDSVMFPQWAMLAYQTGGWYKQLGADMRIPIVVIDSMLCVDTVQYNQMLDRKKISNLESKTKIAFDLFERGLADRDVETLGEAAYISAIGYQEIVHSELIERSVDWAAVLGAFGPVRAHSGSITGLLFPDIEIAEYAAKWLSSRFSGIVYVSHTTGGGEKV